MGQDGAGRQVGWRRGWHVATAHEFAEQVGGRTAGRLSRVGLEPVYVCIYYAYLDPVLYACVCGYATMMFI